VEHCQLKCLGRKKFNLVVTPIHPPPLGDIKVLSVPRSREVVFGLMKV
jgi:hypothetical protein